MANKYKKHKIPGYFRGFFYPTELIVHKSTNTIYERIRHAKPPVEVKDKDLMFRLIRASFNQRRKTLQNGLSNAQDLSFSKEEIAAAIESLGLSPSVRGETLTLAQFAALSDVLGK